MNALAAARVLVILPVILPPMAAESAARESLPLEDILRHMTERDQANVDLIAGYTCLRRYAMENRRFHKRAEVTVRMTYSFPGHKKFEVLSESGPAVLRQRVLLPMVEAEKESSRDDIKPLTRMTRSNYDFKLICEQVIEGRRAYLLEVAPKTGNKFLIRGRVWIDAVNFGIIRIEAIPAHSPSMLIHNTHVVQQAVRFNDVWLPLCNRSDADSFFFGHTDVTIDSWDYEFQWRTGGKE